MAMSSNSRWNVRRVKVWCALKRNSCSAPQTLYKTAFSLAESSFPTLVTSQPRSLCTPSVRL